MKPDRFAPTAADTSFSCIAGIFMPNTGNLPPDTPIKKAEPQRKPGGSYFFLARNWGFTLIEVLVAVLMMVIILGPIFLLLRSGAKTSLEGMLRIDTTLQARRVLQQIHADLKQACFPISAFTPVGFLDIVLKQGSPPEETFQFLSYPLHAEVSEVLNSPAGSQNSAPRRAARITYRLTRLTGPQKPFLQLCREVEFPGKPLQKTILSERVNMLSIQPIEIQAGGKNQFYFWVNLRLVDAAHGVDASAISAGAPVTATKAGILLADFFDVVYPEYFHAFWNNPFENRNWHADLIAP